MWTGQLLSNLTLISLNKSFCHYVSSILSFVLSDNSILSQNEIRLSICSYANVKWGFKWLAFRKRILGNQHTCRSVLYSKAIKIASNSFLRYLVMIFGLSATVLRLSSAQADSLFFLLHSGLSTRIFSSLNFKISFYTVYLEGVNVLKVTSYSLLDL